MTTHDQIQKAAVVQRPKQVVVKETAVPAPKGGENTAEQLQRTYGNRAAQRILQAKLKLGPAGDSYEQEADAVAQQVVNNLHQPQSVQRQEGEEEELQAKPLAEGIQRIQRQEGEEEELMMKRAEAAVQRQEDEEELQAKANHGLEGGDVDTEVAGAIETARGGGQALDEGVRTSMEQGFGADFSGVRIHTGNQADALNRSLNARAFTTGSNIFFGAGQYNPTSKGGQELLAHELTHTVQQGATGQLQRQSSHEHGCGCGTCSGVQRQTEATEIQNHVGGVWQGGSIQRVSAHESGCGCSSCGSIQRQANESVQQISKSNLGVGTAQRQAIQRDILSDWATDHKVYNKFGKSKKDSKQMKALTTAVDTYNKKPRRVYDDRTAALDDIDVKIAAWRNSKHKKDPKRVLKVDALEQAIPLARTLVGQQRDLEVQQTQEANERRNRFMELEPELAQFAARDAGDVSNFMPGNTYADDPLTLPRGQDGKLSQEAITKSEEAKQSEKDDNLRLGDQGSIDVDPTVGLNDLKQIIEDQKNQLTQETLFPELFNLTEQNNEVDEIVEKSMNLAGTTVTVRYNSSDVNFDARLELLTTAFQKVANAGFTIPPIMVNLPKLGRKLTISSTCAVTASGKSNRAVFVPPAFVHVSSENYQNPLDDKSMKDPNKLKFLSSQLDPNGVATIIHELGHLLHYTRVPGKYYGLSEARFKDQEMRERAVDQVSEYGNNPREMVAEVFMGLVYGQTFGREIMEMYNAFGGPPKG